MTGPVIMVIRCGSRVTEALNGQAAVRRESGLQETGCPFLQGLETFTSSVIINMWLLFQDRRIDKTD
jgi:hypothetical protein